MSEFLSEFGEDSASLVEGGLEISTEEFEDGEGEAFAERIAGILLQGAIEAAESYIDDELERLGLILPELRDLYEWDGAVCVVSDMQVKPFEETFESGLELEQTLAESIRHAIEVKRDEE